MIEPKKPKDESCRLNAVKSYDLLDTLPEEDYDNITNIVANILDVPIALITLLDKNRNFLKSHHGVPFNESPRDISFCGHAILEQDAIFIIEDASKDERFIGNPLVTDYNAIFYAGVPIISPEGYPLGTLCVFDVKPKVLNTFQIETLISLGKQITYLFELRKKNKSLQKAKTQLKVQNENLKNFAAHISHDLKMPLSNIIVSTDVLKQKYNGLLDLKGHEYLNYIKGSSLKLSDYISRLLEHYETDQIENNTINNTFSVNHLLEGLIDLLNIDSECEIELPEQDLNINSKHVALEQILLNLIGNSLKYNDKAIPKIKITSAIKDNYVYFEITDNGIGIPKEKLNSIFNLFTTVGNLDKFGEQGHGIGLSTVKKLVETLNGEITVSSEIGISTTFMFSILLND